MRAKVDPNLSHGYRLMIKNETHIKNGNGYIKVKFENKSSILCTRNIYNIKTWKIYCLNNSYKDIL